MAKCIQIFEKKKKKKKEMCENPGFRYAIKISNQGPFDLQSNALPSELFSHFFFLCLLCRDSSIYSNFFFFKYGKDLIRNILTMDATHVR